VLPIRILAGVARALDKLPPRAQVRLSGRPPIEVDGQTLDPGAQLILAMRERAVPPQAEMPPVDEQRAATRAEAIAARGALAPVARTRDIDVPGAAGPLRARHFVPYATGNGATGAPLFVYFHGGGGVTGDLDTHEGPCRILCRHAGVHVLAVDYRLAPEAPFPAGADDALAAFAWAAEHASTFNADPGRVIVAGDSAGGTLAAVVAQAAARGELPAPALQLLVYPWLDLSRRRRSYELFGDGFFLTIQMLDWYRGHLLGRDGDASDPRCSPLLAEDLAGVAPAIVVTAGFDPLRDEGEEYAQALRAAGVPVALRRFESLYHGFVNAGGVNRASRVALIEIAGMVRAGLALGVRDYAPRS
jgi:acetyl esterase